MTKSKRDDVSGDLFSSIDSSSPREPATTNAAPGPEVQARPVSDGAMEAPVAAPVESAEQRMERDMREMDARMCLKLGKVCGKCDHGEPKLHEKSGEDLGFRCCLLLRTRSTFNSVHAPCLFSPPRFVKRRTSDAPPPDDLAQRRAQAQFESVLVNRRPEPEHGEINCAACDHLGDFNDEHKSGWCMWLRGMKNTRHPAKCRAFTPITRAKRMKWEWKGIVFE